MTSLVYRGSRNASQPALARLFLLSLLLFASAGTSSPQALGSDDPAGLPISKPSSTTFDPPDQNSDRSSPSYSAADQSPPTSESEAIQRLKDRLKSLDDRALVHLTLGGYAKARELIREQRTLCLRAYGETHSNAALMELVSAEVERICQLDPVGKERIAKALAAENQAQQHFLQGDYASAIRAYREASDTYRALLGPKSRLQYLVIAHLIRCQGGAGNAGEMRRLQQEEVAFRRATLGDRHYFTGRSLLLLGMLETELGSHGEAENHLQESLAILSVAAGRESKEAAYCRAVLAELYNAMGDFPHAEDNAQKAITLASLSLFSRFVAMVRGQAALGRSCIGQGKWTEAEKALARALDLQDLLGSQLYDASRYAENLEDYARALEALNRGDAALRCRGKAASMNSRGDTQLACLGLDLESEDSAIIEKRLASYRERIESAFETAEFAKECGLQKEYLALLTRLYGESHWMVSQEQVCLACAERVLALSAEQRATLRQARLSYANGKHYLERGEREVGLRLLEEAYRIHRGLCGDRELDTALRIPHRCAYVRRDAGDAIGATGLWRQMAPLLRDFYGEKQLNYGSVLLLIACGNVRSRTDPEVEGLLQQSMDIFSTTTGTESDMAAYLYSLLAILYNTRGRSSEAEAKAQQAIVLYNHMLPDEYVGCACAYLQLGKACAGLKSYDEAGRAFQRALDIIDAFQFMPAVERHRELLTEYASVLRHLNKPDEAAVLNRRAAALPAAQ